MKPDALNTCAAQGSDSKEECPWRKPGISVFFRIARASISPAIPTCPLTSSAVCSAIVRFMRWGKNAAAAVPTPQMASRTASTVHSLTGAETIPLFSLALLTFRRLFTCATHGRKRNTLPIDFCNVRYHSDALHILEKKLCITPQLNTMQAKPLSSQLLCDTRSSIYEKGEFLRTLPYLLYSAVTPHIQTAF